MPARLPTIRASSNPSCFCFLSLFICVHLWLKKKFGFNLKFISVNGGVVIG